MRYHDTVVQLRVGYSDYYIEPNPNEHIRRVSIEGLSLMNISSEDMSPHFMGVRGLPRYWTFPMKDFIRIWPTPDEDYHLLLHIQTED